MSSSQFCIEQRQKEQQKLKKLLIYAFASSAVLHGILAYALSLWSLESPKQAEEPMELIIVDQPTPKPKPKVESKPLVEPKPKPLPKPEPVKAQTPPPPVKPPEPVKAQTPPPKPVPKPPAPAPAPKKVLTTPTPAPSQPIVSAPMKNTAQPSSLSSNFAAPISSSVTQGESTSTSNPVVPGSAVATNSAPPRPESNSEAPEGISCVSNCQPEYPAALEGVEGSVGVKLTINPNGDVIGVELADADSNSQVNRQALLAARQMQFSSPGEDAASVQVKIDFTVKGSEYDRLAREEQEKEEQAERERKEQEAARQQQLEADKQARQEQLEQERQARQQQLQQQESTPPAVDSNPDPKPLPTLSPEELDAERLRRFNERMDNY
ncbi:MAG: energy transducer TonB [Cyanobacteria bacterium P01_A01_bin.83]